MVTFDDLTRHGPAGSVLSFVGIVAFEFAEEVSCLFMLILFVHQHSAVLHRCSFDQFTRQQDPLRRVVRVADAMRQQLHRLLAHLGDRGLHRGDAQAVAAVVVAADVDQGDVVRHRPSPFEQGLIHPLHPPMPADDQGGQVAFCFEHRGQRSQRLGIAVVCGLDAVSRQDGQAQFVDRLLEREASDVGFLVRLLPNALYYGAMPAVLARAAPRSAE